MTDLTAATGRYLRTIFDLDEDHVTPRRARISARLGHTKSAVSQKIESMCLAGLLHMADDGRISFTQTGHATAIALTRKHRLIERMLVDMIGMKRAEVHTIAARWEHVMDAEVERNLVPLLGYPATDPWGNPIPGLDQIGFTAAPIQRAVPSPVVPLEVPVNCVIRRFSEHIQFRADVLADLVDKGIEPGTQVTVVSKRKSVYLTNAHAVAELPTTLACAIHVEPLSARSSRSVSNFDGSVEERHVGS
ncbi:hypothetical protein A8M60_07405 [Nocardia farcinica]|nr:hypothetical protein A8M60_07405 [Nocardia farcinica]